MADNAQRAWASAPVAAWRRLEPHQRVARGAAVAGAALVPVFLFLRFARIPEPGTAVYTGWEWHTSSDVLILLGSVAVIVLVGLDLVAPRGRGYLLAAAAIALVTLGLAWPEGHGFLALAAGAYLTVIAAALCCAGLAVAALTGASATAPRPGRAEADEPAPEPPATPVRAQPAESARLADTLVDEEVPREPGSRAKPR